MTVTNDPPSCVFYHKGSYCNDLNGQRPVVANKIDLNITATIASYQRSKSRKKYKAKRDDVISQNRRQNHGRVETRMRTALERRLGFGLQKRDRGSLLDLGLL
jgi:hypothetical protein